MGLRKNKNQGSPTGADNNAIILSETKRVIDIILDIDHPQYEDPNSIGVIFLLMKVVENLLKNPTPFLKLVQFLEIILYIL